MIGAEIIFRTTKFVVSLIELVNGLQNSVVTLEDLEVK
jgi:hypothetical protein